MARPKVNRWYLCALLCAAGAWLLAACGGSFPTAVETDAGVTLPPPSLIPPYPSATLSPLPPSDTALPAPTATLLPTETPLPPTSTPQPSPTALPTIGAGSVMLAPGDLRPMAYVPAGSFWMGAADADANADPDERPRHQVELGAYWIDLYEVTHIDYWKCVQAGACEAPAEVDMNGRSYAFAAEIENAAVINVTWYDARDYCTWAGKRLPSEAEWERAARGDDDRIFPWGDETDDIHLAWSCSRGCIYDPDFPEVYDDFSRPATVGSFPDGVSPYGLFDMAGNVWEWVQDWYAAEAYDQPGQVNPTGPVEGDYRVVRGGSWLSPVTDLRSSYRQARGPTTAWIDVGFRCAISDE